MVLLLLAFALASGQEVEDAPAELDEVAEDLDSAQEAVDGMTAKIDAYLSQQSSDTGLEVGPQLPEESASEEEAPELCELCEGETLPEPDA